MAPYCFYLVVNRLTLGVLAIVMGPTRVARSDRPPSLQRTRRGKWRIYDHLMISCRVHFTAGSSAGVILQAARRKGLVPSRRASLAMVSYGITSALSGTCGSARAPARAKVAVVPVS